VGMGWTSSGGGASAQGIQGGMSRSGSNESGTTVENFGSPGTGEGEGGLVLWTGDDGSRAKGWEDVDPEAMEEDAFGLNTAAETNYAIRRTRQLLPNLRSTVSPHPSPPDQIHCIPSLSSYLDNPNNNISIPRSPPSTRRGPSDISFFLPFMRSQVLPAHYFAWHDYHSLFTRSLHSMAAESRSLEYAMTAFAALVYSVKIGHQGAREVAFTYYTRAIRELQGCLDGLVENPGMRGGEMAVATALQLATFDVHPCPESLPDPCFVYPGDALFCTRGMLCLHRVYYAGGIINNSASSAIQVNVSAISLAWHVSCNQPQRPQNSLAPHSDKRY